MKKRALRVMLFTLIFGLFLIPGVDSKAEILAPNGIDLRQTGPISVSGTLSEGGTVYLSIPIRNYGDTSSPAVHPYTEGYTSEGSLWRADGAQPGSAVIHPNQTVTFQVQHDLWSGHVGMWQTNGVYLWNNDAGTYYQPLAANGYNQQVSFEVEAANLDLRQAGPIEISGNLVVGGKVYLDIPVRNYGNTPSPAIHPYTEGYTSEGSLWRADGAQPGFAVIQPGQTVYFRVEHDLWTGHVGNWQTYGVYLWNNDAGTYYQALAANGYDQQVSFQVQGSGPDLRLNGPINVSGSLFQGEKVYLEIRVRNFGTQSSPSIHPYMEGYTSEGALWRADGAQPSSAIIAPGQEVVFQVEHDLWYGHVGTWETYGVYLWDNSQETYFGPLAANGYDPSIGFNVFDTAFQSLDIQYLDDSNRAIDVEYEVVDTLADGSLLVNLSIRNKLNVPYMARIWTFGDVTDLDGKLDRYEDFSQSEAMPILPKTTMEFPNVHFQHGSYLEVHFPMFGYDSTDRNFIYGLHSLQILSISFFGFIPTGDAFDTYENLITGGFGFIADQLDLPGVNFFLFGEKLGQGDIGGALETLANIFADYPNQVANAFNALFKTSISSSVVKKLPLISVIWNGGRYIWDLAHAPGFAQVTIVPSSRPLSQAEIAARQHEATTGFSVVASTSEQGGVWAPANLTDGDPATGWVSASETPHGEWILLELPNQTPMQIQEISINPGPANGDHTGAALKNFHIDTSLDGFHFTTVLNGSITESDLGQTKTFSIVPTNAAYVRLVVDSNQSDNAVHYVNIADISVTGTAFGVADGHEFDSTPSFANLINSSGVAQIHNIHMPGDSDWHRLQGKGDQEYLMMFDLQGDYSELLIEIYNGDLSELHFSKEITVTGHFTWKAPASNDYLIRITNLDGQRYGYGTDYSFSILSVNSRIYLPMVMRSN